MGMTATEAAGKFREATEAYILLLREADRAAEGPRVTSQRPAPITPQEMARDNTAWMSDPKPPVFKYDVRKQRAHRAGKNAERTAFVFVLGIFALLALFASFVDDMLGLGRGAGDSPGEVYVAYTLVATYALIATVMVPVGLFLLYVLGKALVNLDQESRRRW